jgi:hypothetical protein
VRWRDLPPGERQSVYEERYATDRWAQSQSTAAAEPVVNSPPRVSKPGPKPKPIPENLRKALERRAQDPDASGNTLQAIADQEGVKVGRVKYLEGRMKREKRIARNSAQ